VENKILKLDTYAPLIRMRVRKLIGIFIIAISSKAMGAGSLPIPALQLNHPISGASIGEMYANFDAIATNRSKFHTGIDYYVADSDDASVLAAAAGTVTLIPMGEASPIVGPQKQDNHCMGNVVIIDHSSELSPNGPFTLYAHLKSFDASLANGSFVLQGQRIGFMGNTGYNNEARQEVCQSSARPHLHFELKKRKVLHNPYTSTGDETPTDMGLDACDASCRWGYTENDPDNYGYFNPILHSYSGISFSTAGSLTIRSAGNGASIRVAPSTASPSRTLDPTTVTAGTVYLTDLVAPSSSLSTCQEWRRIRPQSGMFLDPSQNDPGTAAQIPEGWLCTGPAGSWVQVGPETNVVSSNVTAGWNLFSVPLYPIDPSPFTVLCDNLSPCYAIYGYDPNPLVNNYVVNPNILPGQSYWVLAENNSSIDAKGALLRGATYVQPLATGWHMIGQPFNFQVKLLDLKIQENPIQGWISIAEAAQQRKIDPWIYFFYKAGNYIGYYAINLVNKQVWLTIWDPVSARYGPWQLQGFQADPVTLNPWSGFWIYSLSDANSLQIPAVPATPFQLQLLSSTAGHVLNSLEPKSNSVLGDHPLIANVPLTANALLPPPTPAALSTSDLPAQYAPAQDLAAGDTKVSSVVINDLPPPPPPPPPPPDITPRSVAINDVSVVEGNSGTTNAVFTVTLSSASTKTVTVSYSTANNTATAGSDYVASVGTLTFNPGETSKTISVLVNGDTMVEGNEMFFVDLTSATNATIADGQGVGTIIDDDAAPDVRLGNISTRSRVLTGDNVMIGGFIIDGLTPLRVLVRSRGPSMGGAPFFVPGTLANPSLRLFSGQNVIAQNDNWQDAPSCTGVPCEDATQITSTGLDPCQPNPGQPGPPQNCNLESAILITLPPGAYTGIVSGADGGTGVGLVEVFEADDSIGPELSNISTRSFVQGGDNVMIGGMIIEGSAQSTVLIRARGPSMSGAPFFVPGTLANPFLQLYSGQTVIAQNNDWQDAPSCTGFTCGGAAEITAIGLDPCQPNPGQSTSPPGCAQESAILITFAPGAYTAIVSGADGGTGVGLVEVFEVK